MSGTKFMACVKVFFQLLAVLALIGILKVDRTDILIVNIYLILVINAQIALEPLLLVKY